MIYYGTQFWAIAYAQVLQRTALKHEFQAPTQTPLRIWPTSIQENDR